MAKSKIETIIKDIKLAGKNIKTANEIDNAVRVPTGIYGIDSVIGGGIPLGCPIILHGREGSTKSSLAYRIAGNAERITGKPIALLHTEGPFSASKFWAEKCGLPIDDTIVIEDAILENVLNTALEIIRSGSVSCLILDSIGAIMPKETSDKVDISTSYSDRATKLNRFFMSIASNMPKDDQCIIIATNHHYNKPTRYGSVEVLPGGERQLYIAQLRIKLFKDEAGEEQYDAIGGKDKVITHVKIKWVIEKNKFGPSFIDGTYSLYVANSVFPMGTFSEAHEAIMKGLLCGTIKRSGAWYTYNGEKFHGENQLIKALDVKSIFEQYEESKNIIVGQKHTTEVVEYTQ